MEFGRLWRAPSSLDDARVLIVARSYVRAPCDQRCADDRWQHIVSVDARLFGYHDASPAVKVAVEPETAAIALAVGVIALKSAGLQDFGNVAC
jgi:hypothetical protein